MRGGGLKPASSSVGLQQVSAVAQAQIQADRPVEMLEASCVNAPTGEPLRRDVSP